MGLAVDPADIDVEALRKARMAQHPTALLAKTGQVRLSVSFMDSAGNFHEAWEGYVDAVPGIGELVELPGGAYAKVCSVLHRIVSNSAQVIVGK